MTKKILTIAALTVLSYGSFIKRGQAAEDTAAKGMIPKDLIRGVIQQHIGEVKQCYLGPLQQNKDLAGRVLVYFVIGTDGKVTESHIQESSLNSPAFEKCITDTVRSWLFPKPQGGKVEVSYPFVFASSNPALVGGADKK